MPVKKSYSAPSRRTFLTRSAKFAVATVLTGCTAPPVSLIRVNKLRLPDANFKSQTPAAQHASGARPALPGHIQPSLGGQDISLAAKIGQMIMVGFDGRILNRGSAIVQDVVAGRVGGVTLFGRNIDDQEQVKLMTDTLQFHAEQPLLISIDQEGGSVSRLGSTFGLVKNFSAAQLGHIDNLQTTVDYAKSTAATLRHLGINLNLAPVVDLNVNPFNPVIGLQGRSFSSDPDVVTKHALAFIRAHHRAGVFCTLKHFPGHGSSTADSHVGFVDVTDTWSEDELKPFASIIDSGRCDAVMTAHIFNRHLDQEQPATLSHDIITGILRRRMKYDGVIITDDIQMGAIRHFYEVDEAIELAITAGVDMFAFSRYSPATVQLVIAIVESLVSAGKVSEDRIHHSYKRIMALKSRLKLLPTKSDSVRKADTPLKSPPQSASAVDQAYLDQLDKLLY